MRVSGSSCLFANADQLDMAQGMSPNRSDGAVASLGAVPANFEVGGNLFEQRQPGRQDPIAFHVQKSRPPH